MKIGIASYTNEQWQLLKGCAADREKLDRTYADWEKTRDEAMTMLRGQGYEPVLVPMDVSEIVKWCQAKDKANDMSSRAEICSEKMKNMFGKWKRDTAAHNHDNNNALAKVR